QSMVSFLRELAVTDPYWLPSAHRVLQENQTELSHLLELLADRLADISKTERRKEDGTFASDDKFLWRYTLRGNSIPPEIEEELQSVYESDDWEKADRLFTFYTEAFPNYADGFNYRGLIALRNGNL